jgi:hypothetical protein
LSILKFHADRNRDQHENDKVRCPDELSINPNFVTYYDLYFTEDFKNLQNGLIDLLESGVTSSRITISPQSEIQSIFDAWRLNPGAGGWYAIGPISFGRCQNAPTYFDEISIKLIKVSPTCVNLLISAFTSNLFKSNFQKIISKGVENTFIVNKFSFFKKGWRSASILPSNIRQNELEELFLEMNREVVMLLREFVGRGWGFEGPLPSIQFFAYEEHNPNINFEDKSFFEFWRSLNLLRIPGLFYQDDSGVSVIPPWRQDTGTITSPYRVLVNKEKYLKDKSVETYGTPENALFCTLEEALIIPLAPLLALREYCQRAVETTSSLRERLSPSLSSHRLLSTLGATIHLMRIPPRLNSMQFALSRVTTSTIKQCLKLEYLEKYYRKIYSHDADGSLAIELPNEIFFLRKDADDGLTMLRNSYQNLWNFIVQWILIFLSLIAVIIAAAQFLPKHPANETAKKTSLAAEQSVQR